MFKKPELIAVRSLRCVPCIFWLMIFAAIGAVAQTPESEVALEQGKAVERELKGGESAAFRIAATSGQFLHLLVDQKGIDVAITLFAPDGVELLKLDGPNGSFGTEEVAIVTSSAGEYRLLLSSGNKAASGIVKASLTALRPPTDADLQRVEAESRYIEAQMKLRPQRTFAARMAAIEKLNQSLAFFQSIGDQYRQGWISYIIALTHAQSGQYRQAHDFAGRTIPLFKNVNDTLGEASAVNLHGGMADQLGDPQGALVSYSQALALVRANDLRGTEASVLNNIGKIHNDLSDWQKAIDYYNQALPIVREIGDVARQAIFLHNIGVAYVGLGEYDRALDLLNQALPLRRKIGDKAGEADTLRSTGYVYNLTGRSQEALQVYEQSLALQSGVGARRDEGITLDHIGIAYATIGQPTRALEFHQQALERHRAAESPRNEGIALGNIGHVHNTLGQSQKAIEFYEQALAIFRNIGDRQNEAKVLEGLARAQREMGDLNAAQKSIEEALERIESVRSNAGAQQARSSYLASRYGAFELYTDLLMQRHSRDPAAGYNARALQASERVRARSLMELLGEARVDIRQGVDAALISREREIRHTLNAKAQRQIQLRAQKGGSKEEIATLEREMTALEGQYQQVQAAIRNASPAYAGLTQPRPLSLSEIQGHLDDNTLLLEYSLGDKRSFLWAVSNKGLKSFELPGRQQIQKGARAVYELLTVRGLNKVGETADQKRKRTADADSRLQAAVADLSQMILAPVAGEVGGKRLVIVADDALQYIPFGILPIARVDTRSSGLPYRPLVLDHEIVSLPSVSALSVQRQTLAGRTPGLNSVAVIADPVFSADDARIKRRGASNEAPQADSATTRKLEHITAEALSKKMEISRLLFTRNEADQILAMSPRSSSIKALDFKANRATVMSGDLSRYRYVHFATHGYLDSERPDLSALVLSLVDPEGNSEDGFLRAHDIYNLNLPAELVVLSACQTGLGKEIKGEGLVGLTRGFMYAGARTVVVSLWNVNDKATADLMQRFYRGMLRGNLKPAAALRKAQSEMIHQTKWQSPYYWAAFTMQGEWR